MFRVAGNAADRRQRPLSVLARYFLLDAADEHLPRRSLEFHEVNQLVELALKIHERQIRNRERRHALYAILGTIVAAMIAGIVAMVTKR